jgi:hypothetical protein
MRQLQLNHFRHWVKYLGEEEKAKQFEGPPVGLKQ